MHRQPQAVTPADEGSPCQCWPHNSKVARSRAASAACFDMLDKIKEVPAQEQGLTDFHLRMIHLRMRTVIQRRWAVICSLILVQAGDC